MFNFIGYEKVNICPTLNAAILLSQVNITDAALSRIKLCRRFLPALSIMVTYTLFPRAESAGF